MCDLKRLLKLSVTLIGISVGPFQFANKTFEIVPFPRQKLITAGNNTRPNAEFVSQTYNFRFG
jgi:hypothetical protein